MSKDIYNARTPLRWEAFRRPPCEDGSPNRMGGLVMTKAPAALKQCGDFHYPFDDEDWPRLAFPYYFRAPYEDIVAWLESYPNCLNRLDDAIADAAQTLLDRNSALSLETILRGVIPNTKRVRRLRLQCLAEFNAFCEEEPEITVRERMGDLPINAHAIDAIEEIGYFRGEGWTQQTIEVRIDHACTTPHNRCRKGSSLLSNPGTMEVPMVQAYVVMSKDRALMDLLMRYLQADADSDAHKAWCKSEFGRLGRFDIDAVKVDLCRRMARAILHRESRLSGIPLAEIVAWLGAGRVGPDLEFFA